MFLLELLFSNIDKSFWFMRFWNSFYFTLNINSLKNLEPTTSVFLFWIIDIEEVLHYLLSKDYISPAITKNFCKENKNPFAIFSSSSTIFNRASAITMERILYIVIFHMDGFPLPSFGFRTGDCLFLCYIQFFINIIFLVDDPAFHGVWFADPIS